MLRTLIFVSVTLFSALQVPAQKLLREKAPVISLAATFRDGKKVSYGIPKGKFLLLEFWATWCTPCVRNIPHLNELAKEFKGRVEFISISDESADKVSRFLSAHPISGVVAIDKNAATFKSFNVNGRPSTFIINDKGTVVFVGDPSGVTSGKLEQLLSGQVVEKLEDNPERGRLGGWGGGEDPVVTGNFDMSKMGYERYEVIRKAVSESGGTGWKNRNGEVGITLLSVTRRDIIAFANELASSFRVIDRLPDSAATWDVIFYRRTGYEMERAQKEVEQIVVETFAAKVGEESREVPVFMVAYDLAKLIDATKVPDDDPNLKSYELLGDICANIERKTGNIIECPEGADKLYVDVFDLGAKYYSSEGVYIMNWISNKYGISFNKHIKQVRFKTIVPR